ncbi:hypothetical protein DmAi_28910 [Acetobacter persici]|uniref:Uncharacterized protein n=1 Tax=Acetobacter persici TaxID=1076596 RepID=A0A6V8ICM4_9PROT|nr:hypothetical protein HK19_13505 [Acetobacter persici]GFE94832.1 hypothetical protein DmAi_28910 [Acetobacter persici]
MSKQPSLMPWQQEIIDRLGEGNVRIVHRPHRMGKSLLVRMLCGVDLAQGKDETAYCPPKSRMVVDDTQ